MNLGKKRMALNTIVLLCVAIVFLLLVGGVAFWNAQLSSEPPPSWRGLTVGRSTTEELVTLLGQPHAIERWGLTSVYVYRVYREGSNAFCDHRVTISGGVIQAIEECTLLYPQRVLLPELVLRYGRPDLVEWSRTGPGERVVVFSHAGVLADVVGLPLNEAYVLTIVYFRPRSPLRVMIENWTWLSPVDPFPGSDILGPKDPWFGTSRECRRTCDNE